MSELVAKRNGMDERPPAVSLAAIGNCDDQQHEKNETTREDSEKKNGGGLASGRHAEFWFSSLTYHINFMKITDG